VAIVWLCIIGEWSAIGVGVGIGLGANFLLAFALLPQSLIAAPAIWFGSRGIRVGFMICVGLSAAYLYALMTVWACAIFYVFGQYMTVSDEIPMLLWVYAVGTGPWSVAASKEGPGEEGLPSRISTFFLQAAFAITIAMVLFANAGPSALLGIFIGVMVVAYLFHLLFAGVIARGAVADV